MVRPSQLTLAVAVLVSLAGASSAGKSDATEASAAFGTVPSPKGPYALQHTVRLGRSILADDFLPMFVKNASSKRRLQQVWPETSMGGQIWTSLSGDAPFEGEGIELHLDLAPGFVFADRGPKLDLAFASWMRKNGRRPNGFSKRQVALLKEEGDPHHSGFYDDHALAGILNRYSVAKGQDPSTGVVSYNIVNVSSLRRIKMEIPWYHLEDIPKKLPGRRARSVFKPR